MWHGPGGVRLSGIATAILTAAATMAWASMRYLLLL
jgi:hypothetical protein